MAENPLLPNAELLALLALTKRCAVLEAAAARSAAKPGTGRASRLASEPTRGTAPLSREALLAGTMLQLQPGDLLVADPADATLAALTPPSKRGNPEPAFALPELGRNSSRLMLGTAMAAALRSAATDHIVLAFVRAGTAQPDWATALTWAQDRLLSVIFVCADHSGPAALRPNARSAEGSFEWKAVQRTAARLKLPILSVDGEDAVAVYRVMQESVIRARAGGGPAVLWAMLPSRRELQVDRPRASKPLNRLQKYLRSRRIALQDKPR